MSEKKFPYDPFIAVIDKDPADTIEIITAIGLQMPEYISDKLSECEQLIFVKGYPHDYSNVHSQQFAQ